MANIITRNANTITVNRFIVGKARTALLELVTEHKGVIAINNNGFYEATFPTEQTAKSVKTLLGARYRAHNVRMPEPKKVKGNSDKTEKTAEPKYIAIVKPFAGKGKSANKDVAAALRAAGMEPTGEAWAYWQSVR